MNNDQVFEKWKRDFRELSHFFDDEFLREVFVSARADLEVIIRQQDTELIDAGALHLADESSLVNMERVINNYKNEISRVWVELKEKNEVINKLRDALLLEGQKTNSLRAEPNKLEER